MRAIEELIIARSKEISDVANDKLDELIAIHNARDDGDDDVLVPFFVDCAAAIYAFAISHAVKCGVNEKSARGHVDRLKQVIEEKITLLTLVRDLDDKVGH